MSQITLGSKTSETFGSLWARIWREMEEERSRWIKKLRSQGIVMAHPDDGWVNRQANEINPTYPDFDDGFTVGSLIALGTPEKYRIVKITGKREGILPITYWKFENVADGVCS